MRVAPWWTETYLQHLREQKEAAFAKWVRSGYRDRAAWLEFIRLFEEQTRIWRNLPFAI